MIQVDDDGDVFYVREDKTRFLIATIDPVKPLIRFVTNTRIEGVPITLLHQIDDEVFAYFINERRDWE